MTIAVQTAQTATLLPIPRSPGSETPVAGLSQASPVAGYLVTLTVETLTVFVLSLLGMTQVLFDGLAAEVGKVIGLLMDEDHQPGLCLGDPTAYV